jgi:hypothetical protein
MDFKIKCSEVENRPDYYDVEIKTYKDKISGRFERSTIRHMIEILDNSINVGLKCPQNQTVQE